MRRQSMKTREVPVAEIVVPGTRVTAVYDEELQELLKETMAAMGMITPVVVVQTPLGYRLVDGLHRLQEVKAAGCDTIDAVVYEGEEKDSLLMNLVLNRTRGKTKASEMATVIGALYQEYGLDSDAIREKTGLSREYIEKLIKISQASPSVQELLDQEIIGVGAAYEISRLPAKEQQDELCARTQIWRYMVKELKELVDETLRIMQQTPGAPPPPPTPVAQVYHCEGCGKETEPKYLRPVMLCPDCFGVLYRLREPAAAESKDAAEHAQ
jgi:ParB/RepB/Spo0J family partition protein